MQNQPVDSNELNQMIDSLRRERNGNSSSSAVRPHDGQMMPLNNPNNVSAGNEPAPAGAAAAAPATPTYSAGGTTSVAAPENVSASNAANSGSLDEIKREAVTELRPLVDKLELKPADKFDVLLLLIRSNDDSSLIADAHRTALQIDDEARRAQALLAVIQEVDYFKQKK